MEGLIPMVLKAIKKSRIRSQYENLSSGASQSYNIADFYVNGQNPVYINTHSTEKVEDKYMSHHRRHKSAGDFYVGYSPPGNNIHTFNGRPSGGGGASPPSVPKKLVRFRSQRMFSCITGA